MPLVSAMHTLLIRARAILFPDMCFGCDRIGSPLCPSCTADIARSPARRKCAFCDQEVAHGICHRHANRFGLERILAISPYAHPIARKLIEGNKYHGIQSAPLVMGELMLPLLDDLPFAPTRVIPIPSTRARTRTRGGSHVLPIAHIIARELHIAIDDQSLVRIKNTPPLARLHSPQERAKSLRGAFSVTPPLTGERILLVDDVVTSGSTLREATRELRNSGATQVCGVVFAKA